MKKTIVVLGATGKVGRKISEILLKEGHDVKVVARKKDELKKFSDMGAETIVADITDIEAITKAFMNADSAFVLTPPHFTSENYREFQREVGNAIIEAIQKSEIKYIVNLSSCGAHMHEGNGLIAGLAEQEVKLNQLADINIVHLRPAYFMENSLLNIGLIKGMGINGTTAATDHRIPMVATKDIALIASKYLASQNFTGKTVRQILGDRDYSFTELTRIVGNSIGKPDLECVQFTADQAKQAMIAQGVSANVADDVIGMETSLKNGVMNYEKRTISTSSPTSAEAFAIEVFVPAFNAL